MANENSSNDPDPSFGQESKKFIIKNPLETARLLVENGQFSEARIILDALEKLLEQNEDAALKEEVIFQKGLIAFGLREFKEAEKLYRSILDNSPSRTRVRLELARTLFMLERDTKARYHFERAIAGDLPKEVNQNVNQFLYIIKSRRIWYFNAEFGLLPDTNINAATDSNTVTLFNLPFTLDEDAKASSGIGGFVQGIVAFRPKLSNKLYLATNLSGLRNEYSGEDLDSSILSFTIGPELVKKNFTFSIGSTNFKRWFGSKEFNAGYGGYLRAAWRVSSKISLALSFSGQKVVFDNSPERTGPFYSVNTTVSYGLNSKSVVRLLIRYKRESARVKSFANSTYSLGINYSRELPKGITITFNPEFLYRPFQEEQAIFGKRRMDWQTSIRIAIVKRNILFLGMAPRISWTFTHNNSNITLFKYNRHQFRLSLIKEF